MNWKIELANNEKKALFTSDFPAFDHCFEAHNLQSWVMLIDDCLNEDVIQLGEYAKIIYPEWINDYAPNMIVPNDCVVHYLIMDDYFECLPKKTFESGLLAFSKYLLEMHKNSDLPMNWANEMTERIAKLEEKLKK